MQPTETVVSSPLPAGKVLALMAAAIVLGTLVVVGIILPAEFDRDPLGVGVWTGLDRLSVPAEGASEPIAGDASALSREYAIGFRSDIIEIPLAGLGSRGRAIEYKVTMKKDATLIYEWSVPGIAEATQFYSDLHGETPAPDGGLTVATYRQAMGTGAKGAMVAAFDGIHGWYLQNRSPNPVVVTLRISGFYELIEPAK